LQIVPDDASIVADGADATSCRVRSCTRTARFRHMKIGGSVFASNMEPSWARPLRTLKAGASHSTYSPGRPAATDRDSRQRRGPYIRRGERGCGSRDRSTPVRSLRRPQCFSQVRPGQMVRKRAESKESFANPLIFRPGTMVCLQSVRVVGGTEPLPARPKLPADRCRIPCKDPGKKAPEPEHR
jgi:hypothetical protein